MSDTTELDKFIISLAELRMLIVGLMKDGLEEAPLGQLLLLMRPLAQPAQEPIDRTAREG